MTSDWKDRANKRRDERHTKVSDEYQKPKPSKKDCKKWCKGKVGQEHTPKCMPYSNMTGYQKAFSDWKELCCTTCGKVLDRYYPNRFRGVLPPDWVTKDE